jgi:hypothetical protein
MDQNGAKLMDRVRPAASLEAIFFELESIGSFFVQKRETRGRDNDAMHVAFSIAAAGAQDAASRFAQSAAQVVEASTPGLGKDANLASAIVGMNMAQSDFKASVAVLKTADKMMGALLNIVA